MTALEELTLVPRPRRVDPLGEGPAVDGVRVVEQQRPDLAPQGFRLHVEPGDAGSVQIEHADEAGLRYAHGLLDQIRRQCIDGRLPALRLEDEPDVPVRAVLLDVSRDRVPTRATLERFADLCALVRINQLQLYVEHTFAYKRHERVWRDASPLTPDDIHWFDGLCVDRGIELVPNQNCFGHMERWLRLDPYRARAECPDGFDLVPGFHRPPSVLAPTRSNATFALGLLDELLPNFRSRAVNIGGDEPFELGRGVSREQVAEHGLGRVYLDHLVRLTDPLLADGRVDQVQIWADVLRRHPGRATELHEGVVPLVWCYEAPPPGGERLRLPLPVTQLLETMGTDVDAFSGFGRCAAPLVGAGVPFWVAAGTSSWNSLVGRLDNAKANLVDAAETAREQGCGGFLITDWGDNGHHQPPSISFGPIVYGAAVAWGLDANRDLDLRAVLDGHVFDDPTGRVSAALDRLGQLWTHTGQQGVNASPLHAALFPGQPHLILGRPDPAAVREVAGQIDAELGLLAAAEPGCVDADEVVAEVSQAARLARHGSWRLLGDDGPDAALLQADLAELVDGQARTWLARSRPGGLRDSLARLDPGLAEQLELPDP